MINGDMKRTICFAEFELDTAHRRLMREGEQVVLNPKAFDLLVFLAENRGRVVTKDEILDGVWDGQFVEEANLTVQMSTLRKALGEKKNSPQFLVTVPGKVTNSSPTSTSKTAATTSSSKSTNSHASLSKRSLRKANAKKTTAQN